MPKIAVLRVRQGQIEFSNSGLIYWFLGGTSLALLRGMRINQLTFFRFVAAILVVIFHFGQQEAPFNSSGVLPFVLVLNSLVSFFFLLSGFVLAIAYFNKPDISKKTFYFHRIARIYPLYALALFLYLLPNILDGHPLQNISVKQLWMNLTLTQSVFADNALSLNYPGWSLSVELFFYLSFPFIFPFLMKRSSKTVAIACASFWAMTMISYYLSIEVFQINPNYTMYFPLYHLSTFVTGIGAGILFFRHKEIFDNSKAILAGSTIILSAVAAYAILSNHPVLKYHHSGLFNPLFLSVVLLFAIDKAPFKKLLNSRPLVFLGEASFGIYILQFSVWCVCWNFSGRFNLPWLLNFWVCLAVLVVLSMVCYKLIEMPFVNLAKGLKFKKASSLPLAPAPIQLPIGFRQQTFAS